MKIFKNERSDERFYTGEIPYTRKKYGGRFKQSGNLETHKKIHTESPYKCKRCKQKFRNNFNIPPNFSNFFSL